MGFTPRAIRHVRRNWQFSSSGVAKISEHLWVLSLETASWGAHTQFTFQKYPCLGPQMTSSGIIRFFCSSESLKNPYETSLVTRGDASLTLQSN